MVHVIEKSFDVAFNKPFSSTNVGFANNANDNSDWSESMRGIFKLPS